MDSALEQQRLFHEEIERLHRASVDEYAHISKAQRERVNAEHRISKMCERAQKVSHELLTMYDDTETRRNELLVLSCGTDLVEFDRQMTQIRGHYRKNPHELAAPMHIDNYIPSEKRGDGEQESSLVKFSGEEGYGRYLDLHELHNIYLNLKGITKMDYLDYLVKFDVLFDIDRHHKTATYKKYLEQLVAYLEGFYQRAKPLADISETLHEALESFEIEWSSNAFPGWNLSAIEERAALAASALGDVDLSHYSSPKALEALGLERLKSILLARGLKCGGTLQQRAERLFAAKGQAANPTEQNDVLAKTKAAQKEIARLEKMVYTYKEILEDIIKATRDNVERKMSNPEDNEAHGGGDEDPTEEIVLNESDDEDEKPAIYNPKDVPLDFDGKPIPYWLFKLHGLNIRYPCEICSGDTYRGPKAFQRHFQEWKHSAGMRALRIPNTSHFHNVTSVKDALALWEKIKSSKDKDVFQPNNDEEYEDAYGNVFNKKTYDDLKREGLI